MTSYKLLLRTISFLLFTSFSNFAYSEGTKQLAPNENIVIAGVETTDIASLHINSGIYNNFASRKNKNPESRLYVHISDPNTECIFLGFSAAHIMNSEELQDIEYWILDPSGKEIFGGVKLFDGNGEISNWEEAVNGPQQLVGGGGYDATYISSEDLTSKGWTEPGDYYIEFKNRSSGLPFLIDFFDITVASCGPLDFEEKTGRVWAYNWALFSINDFGFPNRPFNGAFYICAPDTYDESKSFITKIDFNGSGFQPGAFNFAFNSFGADTTGNVLLDRQSVENRNRTFWEYPIYLNDPVDICEEAVIGDAQIKSIRRCDDKGFEFGVYIKGNSQVEFLLDFHEQDGLYTAGSKDIVFAQEFEFSGLDTLVYLYWDGFDGLGNNYNNLQSGEIPTKLLYGQSPFHFPIYDGEYLFKGLNVEEVRPRSFNPLLLFYDDSNISEEPGTISSQIELIGCDSPCHSWNNYISNNAIGFGNKNTINTWWFGHQIQEENVFEIPSYYKCKIEAPATLCDNDTINLFVRPQLTPLDGDRYPITGISWVGPHIVGSDALNFVKVDGGGEYFAEIFWVNDDDAECSTTCSFMVQELSSFETEIDTTILFGDVIKINNQSYSSEGRFIQNLIADNGCDSVLFINIEVEIPDVFLSCMLEGKSAFCKNETAIIKSSFSQSILPNLPLEVLSYQWSGPDIIDDNTDFIEIGEFGTYTLTVEYMDFRDSLLSTECQFKIEEYPIYSEDISVELFRGESFTINNKVYTKEGQYVDSLLTINNCDSILNLEIIIKELPIVDQFIFFDMEDCQSSDYERLLPSYISQDYCLSLDVTNLYREQPELNAHSCTNGVDGGSAICISSDDNLDYDNNSDKHLRFEINVEPEDGRKVVISQFSFFEKSPEYFSWIVGEVGLNNFPNKFAITVRANDTIIFFKADQFSTRDWSNRIFDFEGNEDFCFSGSTHLEFSLMAYDLIGNSSNVTAWDIDNIQVVYKCGITDSLNSNLNGVVTDVFDQPMENVFVEVTNLTSSEISNTHTNQFGEYAFEHLNDYNELVIKASFVEEPLHNVSTLDLLIIQRHILGLKFFENPYQYIAGDVNFDKSITALDLIALRKIILGISDNFEDNKSWVFLSKNLRLQFDDFWNYTLDIPVNSNRESFNMEGIKIGDVNSNQLDGRSNSNCHLKASINVLQEEENKCELIFSIDNLSEIDGFQFEIDLKDSELLDLVLLNNEVTSYHNKITNTLTVIYTSLTDDSYDDEFIRLRLSKGQFNGFQDLRIVGHRLNAEAYMYNRVSPLKLQIEDEEGISHNEIVVYPNPSEDELYLNFYSKHTEDVNISLYNMKGELVFNSKYRTKRGENRIGIHNLCNLKELSGVYILQFRHGNEVFQEKVICY